MTNIIEFNIVELEVLSMHRKKHGRFWRTWHDERQEDADESEPSNHEHWAAWHAHMSDFLGMPPERHWLFSGRRFRPWFSGSWGPPVHFNPFVADLMSKGGGLLSMFVLMLLVEKPRYGNELMREIESRTGGSWASNPGAIYPLLNEMESYGLLVGEWEDEEKRTRRIYHLTQEGSEEFERLKELMRPKLEQTINILKQLYDEMELKNEET
jgi:PadR family transcriptional regulator, regulatory protein PadR